MDASLDEKKDLLCRAIAGKLLVQFKYDGRSRIVEPFACGISSAKNYLLRGFSNSRNGQDQTAVLEIIRTNGDVAVKHHATRF